MHTDTDTYLFDTECGGKMHLREGEYDKAHTDFFEAFKVRLAIVHFDIWDHIYMTSTRKGGREQK